MFNVEWTAALHSTFNIKHSIFLVPLTSQTPTPPFSARDRPAQSAAKCLSSHAPQKRTRPPSATVADKPLGQHDVEKARELVAVRPIRRLPVRHRPLREEDGPH